MQIYRGNCKNFGFGFGLVGNVGQFVSLLHCRTAFFLLNDIFSLISRCADREREFFF